VDLIYRFDPFAPVVPRDTATPEKAMELLARGNSRFVQWIERMQQCLMGNTSDPKEHSLVIPVSPISMGLPIWPGATLDQKPFAIFLGCSDARVPVEPIFDLAFNDAFVIRVAGNILGTACLGSLNYAIRSFDSLKLVVVLGHSGCGAVTAAVDTYLKPTDFGDILVNFALRTVVDRIQLAVRHAAKAIQTVCCFPDQQHPLYRTSLVEAAVYLNAAITAFEVKREIESQGFHHLKVVYGVYDLTKLRVHARTDHDIEPHEHLIEPPRSNEQFHELAFTLAEGVRKRGFLG
jgi:carbonic anhydrase